MGSSAAIEGLPWTGPAVRCEKPVTTVSRPACITCKVQVISSWQTDARLGCQSRRAIASSRSVLAALRVGRGHADADVTAADMLARQTWTRPHRDASCLRPPEDRNLCLWSKRRAGCGALATTLQCLGRVQHTVAMMAQCPDPRQPCRSSSPFLRPSMWMLECSMR
jgi:hypothetical protein